MPQLKSNATPARIVALAVMLFSIFSFVSSGAAQDEPGALTPADREIVVADAISISIDKEADSNPPNGINEVVGTLSTFEVDQSLVELSSLPGIATVQRTLISRSARPTLWRATAVGRDDFHLSVTPAQFVVPANGEAVFSIHLNAVNVPLGEERTGTVILQRADMAIELPVKIVRDQAAVHLDKSCSDDTVAQRGVTDCKVTITNHSGSEAAFTIADVLSSKVRINPASVSGAELVGNQLVYEGVLSGSEMGGIDVLVDSGASPFGYLSIGSFNTIVVNASDESITNFDVPAFLYNGQSYNQIGVASNGYIVVGGGSADDIRFVNVSLPDVNPPNNVLAPFWTDLNPEDGGRILITTLTNGLNFWLVVEWEAVPNYSDGETNTFQVWIEFDGAENIFYTYGPQITAGNEGLLTVGAEDESGRTGGMVAYNGSGELPAPSFPFGDYTVRVISTDASPAVESHSFSYQIAGARVGPPAASCAYLSSDQFDGISASCHMLEVVPSIGGWDAWANNRLVAKVDGQLTLNTVDVTSVSLRAKTIPLGVGSVIFEIDGYQTIDNGRHYMVKLPDLAPGEYKLTATPYTGGNGTGSAGLPSTVVITVVE